MIDTVLLRKKIIDLAIRGMLVSQNHNDAPASELYKQINEEKKRLLAESKLKKSDLKSEISKRGTSYFEKVDNSERCIDTEIPFQIPENWVWIRISNICYPQESIRPIDDTFRYIDIDSIDNKLHRVTVTKTLKSSQAPSRASRKLSAGDTLFSLVRPYLENIGFISEDLADCIGSTGFYVLKPIKTVLDPKYLFILMTSQYAIKGLNSYMKGDNSPSIRGEHIGNLLLPIPCLKEQERIVNVLGLLFPAILDIETNQETIINLSAAIRAKVLSFAIEGKYIPTAYKSFKMMFGNVVESINPKLKLKTTELSSRGKYPVVSQSSSLIDGYTDDKSGVINAERPVVVFGDHTRIVKYIDFDFVSGADGTKILLSKTLYPQYLYFATLWAVNQFECRGYSRHYGFLKKIEIPIYEGTIQNQICDTIRKRFSVIDSIIE